MSRYNFRPEAAYKRAEELLAVGQDEPALQILLDMVGRINRSASVATMEPIMLKFVELCVQQKKSKFAKEGLMSYKNFAQNSEPASIEVVVKKYITLIEEQLSQAVAQADKLVEEAVEDLEETETPESLLMWTVSGEETKDRTDRKVVTPYLKMLWEAYRNTLDILKNNSRLESTYQIVATKTFHFCTEHKRKNEFRRLCELFRHHLTNFSKYSHQTHSVNLNDADSLQRQLSIRFGQLNAATDLELWHEAFRTVEDIHNLLANAKSQPKASMMVNYYNKMTKILFVSQNYLFHAAAQNCYYSTLKSSGARVSLEQRQDISSQVLLAVLSVPVITTPKIRAGLIDQDDSKAKSARLTSLLGLNSAPTRSALLKELLGSNILERVRPEIRELYQSLEAEFHPLSICKKLAPILSAIESRPEEAKYVAPLREVILTRLLQQLSQVYTTIKLDSVVKLASLAPSFEYTSMMIEKIIMNGCKRGELAIKIDHHTRAITFETDIYADSNIKVADGTQLQKTPSELMRTQLSSMAKRLHIAVNMIDPTIHEKKRQAKKQAISQALSSLEEEHIKTVGRRAIIERRKEIAETLQIRKEKEEAREKALRLQKEQELERQRVLEETKLREAERKRQEIENIQLEEAKKLAESIKEKMNIEVELSDLNTDRLMQIQVEHLEKEKTEMAAKMKSVTRQIDHLERAYRQEEIPLLERDYQRQLKADKAYYELSQNTLIEASKAKHEEDMKIKSRLSHLVSHSKAYVNLVNQNRSEAHSVKRQELQAKLEAEKEKRREQYRAVKEEKDRLAEEERQRIAKEEEELQQREREENARRQKEEAEREAREAEKASKQAAEQERLRKLDEVARIQREKERLAEEKIARSRAEATNKSTPPSSGRFGFGRSDASPASSGKYVPPSARRQTEASKDSSAWSRPSSESSPAPPTSNPWRRTAAAPAPTTASPTSPATPSKEPYRPPGAKSAWREREAAKTQSGQSPSKTDDDGFTPVSRSRRS